MGGGPGSRADPGRAWIEGYDSSHRPSARQMMSPVNWPPGDQRPG